MTPVARIVAWAAAAGAVALVSGCASGPEIRRDTNPAADFGAYRSFAFFSPLATDREGYESVLSARLKAATRRNLEAKGYVYGEADPDLKVNFYANVEDKQEVRAAPVGFGYYGYRRGIYAGWGLHDVETVNYQEGTLTIDLVDPRQKSLVWSATAEGRVTREARQNPGPAIDAVVDDMLAPLPGPGRM